MPDSLPDGITWCIVDRHKKVEQALGRSLRSLFEQLAWHNRQLRCFFRNIWSESFTYVEVIRAPALANTPASASQQAAQLSPRAAPPALCLSDILWPYTLVKTPGSFRQDVPFFAFFVAFSGDLDENTAISLPRCHVLNCKGLEFSYNLLNLYSVVTDHYTLSTRDASSLYIRPRRPPESSLTHGM